MVAPGTFPGFAERQDHPGNSTRLLIAEDDLCIIDDLNHRLKTLNYTISGTTNRAEEVCQLAESLQPDMILMDIHLSGNMDGVQAAEEVRTLEIPVLYITGCSDLANFERAKLTEPCGFVLKPYETSDLRVGIELGLHKHRSEKERKSLVRRLDEAVATVKTLRGMLSICSYCKRIKDQDGNWPEMETYVMKNSYASFSHGMCPGCFERVNKQLEAMDQAGGDSGVIVLG